MRFLKLYVLCSLCAMMAIWIGQFPTPWFLTWTSVFFALKYGPVFGGIVAIWIVALRGLRSAPNRER